MFAKKYEPIIFGFLLSGLMSLLVSGISTLRAMGVHSDFMNTWVGAWLTAWIIAFPVVLFAAPLVRRMTHRLVR